MALLITAYGNEVLIETTEDCEILALSHLFRFLHEILTLGAPGLVLKALLDGASGGSLAIRIHSLNLRGREIKVMSILTGKAQTNGTVTNARSLGNANCIKALSKLVALLNEGGETGRLGCLLLHTLFNRIVKCGVARTELTLLVTRNLGSLNIRALGGAEAGVSLSFLTEEVGVINVIDFLSQLLNLVKGGVVLALEQSVTALGIADGGHTVHLLNGAGRNVWNIQEALS